MSVNFHSSFLVVGKILFSIASKAVFLAKENLSVCIFSLTFSANSSKGAKKVDFISSKVVVINGGYCLNQPSLRFK